MFKELSRTVRAALFLCGAVRFHPGCACFLCFITFRAAGLTAGVRSGRRETRTPRKDGLACLKVLASVPPAGFPAVDGAEDRRPVMY